jgi:glycopeptide antibiotics resistance protein
VSTDALMEVDLPPDEVRPRPRRRLRFPWLPLLAAAVVLVVLVLLMWPTKVDGSLVTLVEAFYARFGTGEWSETIQFARFLANVALFVPLALIVGLASRLWWLGFVLGVAASAASELVQRTLPDRVASLEDLAANTFGAAIGATLALAALRPQQKRGGSRRAVTEQNLERG